MVHYSPLLIGAGEYGTLFPFTDWWRRRWYIIPLY